MCDIFKFLWGFKSACNSTVVTGLGLPAARFPDQTFVNFQPEKLKLALKSPFQRKPQISPAVKVFCSLFQTFQTAR